MRQGAAGPQQRQGSSNCQAECKPVESRHAQRLYSMLSWSTWAHSQPVPSLGDDRAASSTSTRVVCAATTLMNAPQAVLAA